MAINFLFGWANSKNVEIPTKANGKTDVGKLFEIYNEEQYNQSKKASPNVEKLDLLSLKDKEYLNKLDTEEIKKAVSGEDQKVRRQKEIVDFVQSVEKGQNRLKRIIVSEIKDKERKEIERLIGEELNAKIHTLGANDVTHILKRHGKSGNGEKTMTDINDFKYMEDVLTNFDYCDYCYNKDGTIDRAVGYLNKYGEHAIKIKFAKYLNNSFYNVVEAIVDGKNSDIRVVSMYKSKIIKK